MATVRCRSRRRLGRHRVGRGHIRIGAVVDVEQDALRALEQDALALRAACSSSSAQTASAIGQDASARSRSAEASERPRPSPPAGRGRGAAHCDAPAAVDLGADGGEIGRVIHADGAAADLVFIGRADAAARGADLARRRRRPRASGPARGAIGRISVALLGDAQVVAADGYALPLQLVDFGRPAPRGRSPRHCR
jgi:hypothetical protein